MYSQNDEAGVLEALEFVGFFSCPTMFGRPFLNSFC